MQSETLKEGAKPWSKDGCSESVSSGLLAEKDDTVTSVRIDQFILFMQQSCAWPCYRKPDDRSEPLTFDEVMSLKREFISELNNS